MRDAGREILDLERKIENSGIVEGATLFLNVKAGVGG